MSEASKPSLIDEMASSLYMLVERGTDSPMHTAAERVLARYEAEKVAAPDLYEALKPFARVADDEVLPIIANCMPPLVSFITITAPDGRDLARIELADLHRARAALAKANTPPQTTGD